MHVVRNNFSPINVARTSKKVGQACFKQCGIKTDMISCCSYVKDKDNHARQIGIK